MTFLLTTEMAFSLWAFFVLYRLSNVFIAWLGSGAGGFFGAWEQRITVFETGGAIVALTVFLLWGARRHLSEWWGRVLSGRRDAVADPIPARWAAFLIGAGIGGMIVWNLCTRMQWWAAVGSVLLYLMVLLILTRIVAESGLFFVQTNVIPADFIGGLTLPYTAADPNVVGAPAVAALAVPKPLLLTGRTIDVLMMHKAMLMHDLREIFMPYVMNGVKAATSVRMHAGKVLAVFGLTAVVGLGAAAYGRISTAYKYGGVNLDWYANIGEPDWVLNAAANYEKSPPSVDWIQAGEHKVLPVNVAHVVVGAALTAGMLLLRARFLWWPLHPFGLVMCGTWAISMFWFSIFLGWLFKACVMAFGGAGLYRKVLPFFLGLILGESVIAVGWLVLGLLTGTPGRIILPN